MQRRIPYAVANYEKIVEGRYHFVDKTRFIRELENYEIPVMLRPRRFGKSLWCSILECYYDVNRKDRFEQLFANTDIGRNPTPAHNSQLVMRFDFSVIRVEFDMKGLEASFNLACRDALKVFAAENRRHADFSGAPGIESAADGLRHILGAVRHSGAPPVHIIIDEYDNFANQLLTTHKDHLYKDVTTATRSCAPSSRSSRPASARAPSPASLSPLTTSPAASTSPRLSR
jgi:hypothetical protein